MVETVDCIVVGAGIVGLACARELSQKHTVYVLEKEPQFGMHASSRNSEVIHSGIYYPQNFKRSTLCTAGRAMLYNYCQQHAIAYNKVGKLLTAKGEVQQQKLEKIAQQAAANNVPFEHLSKAQVAQKEPLLASDAGLFFPETGIVDSHGVMQQLEADIFNQGSEVLYQQTVQQIQLDASGFLLMVNGQAIKAKKLLLAAGLANHQLALGNKIPKLYPCKGHYFDYTGSSPFRHLVYPMPNEQGLGIHATLDLQGRLRFGPDVHYQNDGNYQFAAKKQNFVVAIKDYWPGINPEKLQPAYAGVRAKIQAPGASPCDFMIQSKKDHGIENLVQLFGIESPGLTASLAIAQEVAKHYG